MKNKENFEDKQQQFLDEQLKKIEVDKINREKTDSQKEKLFLLAKNLLVLTFKEITTDIEYYAFTVKREFSDVGLKIRKHDRIGAQDMEFSLSYGNASEMFVKGDSRYRFVKDIFYSIQQIKATQEVSLLEKELSLV